MVLRGVQGQALHPVPGRAHRTFDPKDLLDLGTTKMGLVGRRDALRESMEPEIVELEPFGIGTGVIQWVLPRPDPRDQSRHSLLIVSS
ncbi:hypothetical protein EYF80_062167 [Liparis tanakae]|uniref:Uncharacterized protein n=1 Tax=Liparis tanakae TaxID=230148 RepID=A0A4Z2EFH7_9TELE|nr:hypothetical protein EYF80_062167 [Liparis tanakae]